MPRQRCPGNDAPATACEFGEACVSKSDGAETDDSPIEAIRSLVEKNELGLQTLEDEVLILDDIVWRSPARQIVDPTDIIKRLAEEADKVAAEAADARSPNTWYK